VEEAITPETAAILIEPVQGEGGINVATYEFLQGIRTIADERGLLLFVDEVQCGMGRTGTLFAFEQAVIVPDIVSVAKGIGNGFPLAACLTTNKVAECMNTSSHGSTYGSNPLAMAVGSAVLDVIMAENFLHDVQEVGSLLKTELKAVVRDFSNIFGEVRGRGLILGLPIKQLHKNIDIVNKFREGGLLTSPAEDNVVRITPPLIINAENVAEAVKIIRSICKDVR
jgi:acetylornithine/N-succinyldiaminopimelate aminotransferase